MVSMKSVHGTYFRCWSWSTGTEDASPTRHVSRKEEAYGRQDLAWARVCEDCKEAQIHPWMLPLEARLSDFGRLLPAGLFRSSVGKAC